MRGNEKTTTSNVAINHNKRHQECLADMYCTNSIAKKGKLFNYTPIPNQSCCSWNQRYFSPDYGS